MSQSIMQYLATKKGCPADSIIGTIQYLKHLSPDLATLNNEIIQAIGIDVSGLKMQLAQRQYLLLYIVQTGWKAHQAGEDISDQEVLDRALVQIEEFFSHSFIRMAVLADTTERRQKMSKGELAYEIYCDNVHILTRNELVALIEKELETSTSGATTYYYNAKKKFGDQ